MAKTGTFLSVPDDQEGANPTLVTDCDPLPVNPQLNKTQYGDLKTEHMSPVAQVSATYGLLNQVLTVVDSAESGSVSAIDGKYSCQTGLASNGLAAITSYSIISIKPGQGLTAVFSALFSEGAAGNQQAAGLISSEDLFSFGFLGTGFNIIYGHDGKTESQELTITASATGSENATISVAGALYTVPVTSGTVQHNAYEIALSLNAQVTNYDFSSNNNQVVAQSIVSGAHGIFSFSSATAAASWVQIVAGIDPDIADSIPQAAWNQNTMPELNPTKGNEYKISYQSVFGNIEFYVQDSNTGNYILVHVIRYLNKNSLPSVTNPAFRLGWLTLNVGNTTNVTVSGASAGGFVVGNIVVGSSSRSDGNNQPAVGAISTNIICFRNRLSFGNKRNRAELLPVLVSLSTQANKSVFFEIRAEPIFGGDITWSYLDKAGSLMEIGKNLVTVSGGRLIGGVTVESGSPEVLTFNTRFWNKFSVIPGQTFSIAARVSSGGAGDMQATATWVEDI